MGSPRFTLRQLEIFCAVAQAGNVTRASEVLHMSASATSAAVSELETAMGTTLCVRRKGRGVQLTGEGRTLFGLARRLLEDAAEMGDVIADSGTGAVRGTLRIGYYSRGVSE